MPNHSALNVKDNERIRWWRSHLSLQVFLIYIIVVIIDISLLLPKARSYANTLALEALSSIESEFSTIISEHQDLLDDDYTSMRCEDALVDLRSRVFNSDVLKEIGLFHADGRIFCTSNSGNVSFYLYGTIQKRLENSPRTLSYTQSKLSREKSIALMFTDKDGEGVSVLIPPRYLSKHIEAILLEHKLDYKMFIISRLVSQSTYEKSSINSFHVKSEDYPISVEVDANTDFYSHYLLTHIWIALLIASFVSILYVLRQQRQVERNSLGYALADAIHLGHLEINYQPIVDTRSKQIVGSEALLRWKDPVQGCISPGIFIPLAEKVGLIEELTSYVLSNTVKLIEKNSDAFEGSFVSINISRSVILQEQFIKKVNTFFQPAPHLAKKIVFEITEDNDFSSEELVILRKHLNMISGIGIRVAIDDFGTGYSGLDFLRQFSFSHVKIDRVFVTNLSSDSTVVPLLQAVKELAQNLNMEIIIEGVEEKEQVEILGSLGFNQIQGFYYYKPMQEQLLLELLYNCSAK